MAQSDTLGALPYAQVLPRVQGEVARSLTRQVEDLTEEELKSIIARYLRDHNVKCSLTSDPNRLTEYIYHDMAGLSFISREHLFDRPDFEEIDINSWDDVEIVTAGKRVKTNYTFLSPQHAIDIHIRMFRKTGTPFDEAVPRATADIGEGIRIIALRAPLVDANVAVSSSIRKVNTATITRDRLVGKTLTDQMMSFLELCLMHGVSICFSGETGTGKTTLAGCLLAKAAETLRVYTIEEGSREWEFIRRDANGKVINSVIHTKTRPNRNPELNIGQEELVKDALRFDPDIISPGEIRGREAFEVMGVSNTGHTVLTTTHSNGTLDTPARIVTLAKKAFDMTDSTLFSMCARAFPILVHMELEADLIRRVTEIREVTGCDHGEIQSHLLWDFDVEDNIYEGDVCVRVDGDFRQTGTVSPALQKRLLKKGARRSELEPYAELRQKEEHDVA